MNSILLAHVAPDTPENLKASQTQVPINIDWTIFSMVILVVSLICLLTLIIYKRKQNSTSSINY